MWEMIDDPGVPCKPGVTVKILLTEPGRFFVCPRR
jgi:hypothetical protein